MREKRVVMDGVSSKGGKTKKESEQKRRQGRKEGNKREKRRGAVDKGSEAASWWESKERIE